MHDPMRSIVSLKMKDAAGSIFSPHVHCGDCEVLWGEAEQTVFLQLLGAGYWFPL